MAYILARLGLEKTGFLFFVLNYADDFCGAESSKSRAELSLTVIARCLSFLTRYTQRHETSRTFGKVFGQGEYTFVSNACPKTFFSGNENANVYAYSSIFQSPSIFLSQTL